MNVHPTAIIDPSAIFGSGVTVGPYAVIGPDVRLGDRCQIGAHAVVEYTQMGSDCRVFPGAFLGLEPQHLKYKGEKTSVVIGSRCVFREGVTVHRGTALDQSVTTIGDDCYLMALAHVAHDCRIADHVIIVNTAQLAGHVSVGAHAFISTSVGIHQFVRIGTGAIVSGGAMVSLDVAPFSIAQGDRASLQGVNIVGMRRMGADRNSIRLIRQAYRTTFLSSLLLKDALEHPALREDNPYVKSFRKFLELPKRGFLRPSSADLKDLAEEEALA